MDASQSAMNRDQHGQILLGCSILFMKVTQVPDHKRYLIIDPFSP
jgi:hypothetical protein